jgi:uncharacterized protein YeaO (DUF488 family)
MATEIIQKIWYRVAENKVTPHRVLKTTNTLVYYVCRFTGETLNEYKESKKNSWFESEKAAYAYLQSRYVEEIDEVNKEIEVLVKKLNELNAGLAEASEVLRYLK